MDIKELKKLIEQVQAERKKKTINESWSSYGEAEDSGNVGSSMYQDAVDVLKFFGDQYELKPNTGLAYYSEHIQNIVNFAKQYEKSQGLPTDTPEQKLQAIRKMSNVKVQDYIRNLLNKMGLVEEVIAAIDDVLDDAIAKAPQAEKDILSQMTPKQSVSPTSSTVIRPSGIPSGNNTNPGSPGAVARQAAIQGISTKP